MKRRAHHRSGPRTQSCGGYSLELPSHGRQHCPQTSKDLDRRSAREQFGIVEGDEAVPGWQALPRDGFDDVLTVVSWGIKIVDLGPNETIADVNGFAAYRALVGSVGHIGNPRAKSR